jgi:hypothetical protein
LSVGLISSSHDNRKAQALQAANKRGKRWPPENEMDAGNLHAATSASCSPERDGVLRAPDRAGTVVNKTVKPSAIIGCAKTA